MKRRLAVLAVIVAALSFVVAGPVSATQGYCGISWGSLPKAATSTTISPITNVRAGQHACFDRLVLDFAGKTDGYEVEYVDNVFMAGAGHLLPLRGGAKLLVTAAGGQGDENGWTYNPANWYEIVNVTGWRTFRQVGFAGHYGDGEYGSCVDIGLGVRARLPYRVFYLDGPGAGSRLVIDVAHRWS